MHDKQRQASREARTTINALSVLNNWEYMPISEIVISYFKRNGKDIKICCISSTNWFYKVF